MFNLRSDLFSYFIKKRFSFADFPDATLKTCPYDIFFSCFVCCNYKMFNNGATICTRPEIHGLLYAGFLLVDLGTFVVVLYRLEDMACYAGLLLAPVEGFGLRPGKKNAFLCCFGPFLTIFGVQ